MPNDPMHETLHDKIKNHIFRAFIEKITFFEHSFKDSFVDIVYNEVQSYLKKVREIYYWNFPPDFSLDQAVEMFESAKNDSIEKWLKDKSDDELHQYLFVVIEACINAYCFAHHDIMNCYDLMTEIGNKLIGHDIHFDKVEKETWANKTRMIRVMMIIEVTDLWDSTDWKKKSDEEQIKNAKEIYNNALELLEIDTRLQNPICEVIVEIYEAMIKESDIPSIPELEKEIEEFFILENAKYRPIMEKLKNIDKLINLSRLKDSKTLSRLKDS
jgi:hypothetical protein